MRTVIIYKTKQNETYLAYYTYKTVEEAQKEVDKINSTKPEKLWNGEKINWDRIEKFMVNEQEEMY